MKNVSMYNKVMEFAKNKSKHAGISNIYIIQKEDINGNVIDEYYGMNLMTDYGMSQFFINNTTFPSNIYIGNGTGSFDHTTNSLLSAITTVASTVSSSTNDYKYPMYYDSVSGLITCVCKYLTAYFDYNITGITDTVTISEYGIGTAYNALWTHSYVYDSAGNQTTINKAVNEKLTITVFMCYSYNESLITSGWVDNKFSVITTMERFFNKMYEDNVYTYKRYDLKMARNRTKTSSAFMNNVITRYTNLSDIVLYPGSNNDSGYIDGFCQYSNGFITIEPQMLSTGESFEINQIPVTFNDDCLSYAMGLSDSNIQFTQANIMSISLYNYNTSAWDNTETFTNNENHWCSESSMGITFPVPIYYTNNNTIMTMYVYQNLRTDDAITKINNTDLTTVYATDKYWDKSTWVLISDFNNIPTALRTKRYWITTSNTVSLKVTRSTGELRLSPEAGLSTDYTFTSNPFSNNTGYPITDNSTYGWFMIGNRIYQPSSGINITVGTEMSSLALMNYDKFLLVFNSSTSLSYVDTSALSVSTTTSTLTPLFTTATNCFTNCYRTKSNTGYVCLQSLTVNEANIINLTGTTPTQILLTSKLAACIWGTNYIAYISPTDTTKVHVYDMTTSADVYVFDIPSTLTNVTFMCGHKNHIWITDGSSSCYMFNTTDSTTTQLASQIITIPTTDLRYVEITAVDEALVIYRYNTTTTNSMSDIFCIADNNPTNVMNLSTLDTVKGGGRITCSLRKIKTNTLALVLIGVESVNTYPYNICVVYDLGRFLRTSVSSFRKESVRGYTQYGLFGKSLIRQINHKIPIEYFMEHKIKGTTKTISTVNSIKSIKNKQWAVNISNIADFAGLPPGTKQ